LVDEGGADLGRLELDSSDVMDLGLEPVAQSDPTFLSFWSLYERSYRFYYNLRGKRPGIWPRSKCSEHFSPSVGDALDDIDRVLLQGFLRQITAWMSTTLTYPYPPSDYALALPAFPADPQLDVVLVHGLV
jgi:hypothetical protein